MARIVFSQPTLVSKKVQIAVSALANTRDSLTRLKSILDQITAGGTQKANLEIDAEALVPVGLGATVYDNVVSIKAALDGLAATLAQYDQG
jgi:prefoldin subunit 5